MALLTKKAILLAKKENGTIKVTTGENDAFDFGEDGGAEIESTLDAGNYTPTTLAAEIQTQMIADGDNNATCVYSASTKKYTIANASLTTLELKWKSGTNPATSIGKYLGFDVSADDTGAKTYTGDAVAGYAQDPVPIGAANAIEIISDLVITPVGNLATRYPYGKTLSQSRPLLGIKWYELSFITELKGPGVGTVVIVAGVNDALDWSEDAGAEIESTLDAGSYTPTELAAEIQTQLRADGDNNITCVFSATTNKITIANTTLTSLELLWQSGTNTLTTMGGYAGYDISADDDSAKTHIADNKMGQSDVAPKGLGDLLQACGMLEAIGADEITYTPMSTKDVIPSATIYAYVDGLLHKFKGCRGSVRMLFVVGETVKLEFRFLTKYLVPTDVALATPIYDSSVPPTVMNVSFTFDGTSFNIQQMELDLANTLAQGVSVNDATGLDEIILAGREPKGMINPEAVLIATYDFFTTWSTSLEKAISIVIGTADGNKFTITAPKAVPESLGYGDRDGIKTYEIPFRLNKSTGDDEIQIVQNNV